MPLNIIEAKILDEARKSCGVDITLCAHILAGWRSTKARKIARAVAEKTLSDLVSRGYLEFNEKLSAWFCIHPMEYPDIYHMGEKIPDNKDFCDSVRQLVRSHQMAVSQVSSNIHEEGVVDSVEVLINDLCDPAPITISYGISGQEGFEKGIVLRSYSEDKQEK